MVPPSEPRAQKDEGFARFLKKHSSPTHQRVTTGGRIVPMEQQSRPPVFSLPHPGQDMEEHKSITQGTNGIIKPTVTSQDEVKEAAAANILQPQPQSFMPPIAGLAEAATFNAGTNSNVMPSSNPFGFDAARMQPNHLQAMPPMPYYTGMPGDLYGYMMQQSQMYQGVALPFVGFNGATGPNLPMPFIQNPQMLGLPPSCGITTTPTGPQPQDFSYAEAVLNEAIATFHTLDEQLKGLDRHRAMTERDPYITEQRMTVAHLRAEAKRQISYWSEMLGRDAHTVTKNAAGASNSRLNVQASSYVPLRAHQTTGTSSDDSGSSFKPNSADKGAGQPDFVVDSTRRPIPIVPPPGKSPSPQKYGQDNAAPQDESTEVDEWGVRIGPAPPEIQRQQSQMLKELTRQASISPLDSDEKAVMFTPQGSNVTPPTQPSAAKANKSDTESSSENEWLPTKPGRAPATVEACYERQLDAMRLPPGVISKVRLPDGTITEVRGCGLKRPSSFENDEFERRYWTTKPKLYPEMFEDFVEVRDCRGNSKDAGSIVGYLNTKDDNVERFVRHGLVQCMYR